MCERLSVQVYPCVCVCVGARVCVCALPGDGAVDQVSGQNSSAQTLWVGESAKHSLAAFLSHNS